MALQENEMKFISRTNSISNVIVNTTNEWTQVRAFSKSKMGNVDIMLEPKMGLINVKWVRGVPDELDELYISAKDALSLSCILGLFTRSIAGLEINTADMKHAQIRITSEKLRKEVEEFVNFIIDNSKR